MYAVNIAVFENDEFRGPLFWPVSEGGKRSVSYILEGMILNPKTRLDHETGYNYTINRTGMGWKDTNYELIGRDDEPSEVPRQIVKMLKPFVDTVLQYDEKQQKNAYYGVEDGETMKETSSESAEEN